MKTSRLAYMWWHTASQHNTTQLLTIYLVFCCNTTVLLRDFIEFFKSILKDNMIQCKVILA